MLHINRSGKECSSTRQIRAHHPARAYLPATFRPYRATPLPAHHSSSCAYPLRPRIPTPLTALNPLLTTNPLPTNKHAHQEDQSSTYLSYRSPPTSSRPQPQQNSVRHSCVARLVRYVGSFRQGLAGVYLSLDSATHCRARLRPVLRWP